MQFISLPCLGYIMPPFLWLTPLPTVNNVYSQLHNQPFVTGAFHENTQKWV